FPLTKAKIRVHTIPHHPDVEVQDEAFVMVPKDTAEYGVISDIDDTVLRSYVTSPLMSKTAYYTFFKSAKSRMSFAGAPELYRALRKGSDGNRRNPIFYVSNSPYNLFDFLMAFLETAKLPLGPIMLRDFGLFKQRDPNLKSEKYENIAHILRAYPDLPFILIGDSGEKDADIYQDITRNFPNRIQAIYIRDVQSKRRAKRIKVLIDSFKDVTMILANDSTVIEKHAIEQGFIREQTLEKAKEQLQGEGV
ncbi:MAG: phosphatase domain-containing protein, partial [Saprospiraceae bacterium]